MACNWNSSGTRNVYGKFENAKACIWMLLLIRRITMGNALTSQIAFLWSTPFYSCFFFRENFFNFSTKHGCGISPISVAMGTPNSVFKTLICLAERQALLSRFWVVPETTCLVISGAAGRARLWARLWVIGPSVIFTVGEKGQPTHPGYVFLRPSSDFLVTLLPGQLLSNWTLVLCEVTITGLLPC